MTHEQGILNDKNIETAKNNKQYVRLKIGEQLMSAWEVLADGVQEIPLGSLVEYETEAKTVNGKTYHNLTWIKLLRAPAADFTVPIDTGRRVSIRQTALKCAVDIVIAKPELLNVEKDKNVVLMIAEEYEKWINRPFEEAI